MLLQYAHLLHSSGRVSPFCANQGIWPSAEVSSFGRPVHQETPSLDVVECCAKKRMHSCNKKQPTIQGNRVITLRMGENDCTLWLFNRGGGRQEMY